MRTAARIIAIWFLVSGVAHANFCARDNVPAATLLFPYITVDLNADGTPNPSGQTTITDITNFGSETVVVHFTVWDAAGEPRFTFDEILSGYDVLRINWRDVLFGRGDLFDTARDDFPTPAVPFTRSPFEWGPDGRGNLPACEHCDERGALPVAQNRSVITPAQCPGPPPYGNLSHLREAIVTLLRGALVSREHTGCGSSLAPRADKTGFGTDLGPSPLFFYATADVVASCTTLFPTDPAYWNGIAAGRNVLIGNVIYLDAMRNYSEMMPAVHVEASSAIANGGPSVTGFYEERSFAETNREPLGTAFALSYGNDISAGVWSNVLLWKNFNELTARDDPATGTFGDVSDCGSYLYYAWDMNERSLARWCCPIEVRPDAFAIDPNQFPFATQKVPMNNSFFDLPDAYGWMLIVLPPSYDSAFSDATPETGGYLTRPYMGWAAVQFTYGTYSAGTEAITVANALCFSNQRLPGLGANDGTVPIR